MKYQPLLYLPAMFATCMLFQVLYVACVGLWFINPDLKGHEVLFALIPGFKLLDFVSFIYGFFLMMLYGWAVAITFVFFYNFFPKWARLIGIKGYAEASCCGGSAKPKAETSSCCSGSKVAS